MIHVASVAVWIALLLAAWSAGILGAGWRDGRAAPPGSEWPVFVSGAALALAWATAAGTVLRGGSSLALVSGSLPVPVSAGYRIAALWSSGRGALLTAALALAIAASLALAGRQAGESPFARRLAAALSTATAVLLAVGLLVAPPFAVSTVPPQELPLFLVHPGAALAPLLALVAAVAIGVTLCAAAARPGAGGAPDEFESLALPLLQVAWISATLELLAEQAARGAIGLTTGDALIPGGAAAGPWLWLATGILLHARVRTMLLGAGAAARRIRVPAMRGRPLLAHLGAALVVVAFAVHVAGRRSEVTLVPGQSLDLPDAFGRTWRFVSQGISRFDADGHDVMALATNVTAPGRAPALLTTEQRQYYDATGTPFTRPVAVRGVRRGIAQDLRVVLDSVGTGEAAVVKVAFVPFTVLWIPGAALVLITAIAALSGLRFPAGGRAANPEPGATPS